MSATADTHATEFGLRLRDWRRSRRLSQLDLSLVAAISQRHISWLETGRSEPSRAMVLRLARALDIPLRDRNGLLNAAGFASLYREGTLDAEHMSAVHEALRMLLDQQDPYPGIVVDRRWDVVMSNRCGTAMLDQVGAGDLWSRIGDGGRKNIASLSLHPEALRPQIVNWDAVAPPFVQRLMHDRDRSNDPALRAHLQSLIDMAGPLHEDTGRAGDALLPVVPLEVDTGAGILKMFSIIATFGTPQDITTDELRIESFFPVDDFSRQFLQQLSEQAATGGAI